MALVTVTGASGSIVSQSFANTAGNLLLAQAIQQQLLNLRAAEELLVQNDNAPLSPPDMAGNELVITGASSDVVVPPGFNFAVDSTAGAALTVTGAQNFFGGFGDITFTNVAGAGMETIVAADNPTGGPDGNDFFNLIPGSQYMVGLNDGNNTVVAAGSGTIFGGLGQDTFNVTGGSNTIMAANGSPFDTVFNNGGDVYFMAGAGTGVAPSLTSIVGGAAGSTTVIGADNNIVFYSAASSVPGALLQAGTGNETLWGAAVGSIPGSSANDALVGSPISGTNDLLVGGTGIDALVAGAGNDTMWDGGGGTSNSFFFFIAGHAGGTDNVWLGLNGTAELTGYDTLFGGPAGSDTAAQKMSAGQNADGSAASVGPMGMTYTLGDGTTVTFDGIANASQLKGHIGSS
jgi:Ca2+-binding RTX toxin-like protein